MASIRRDLPASETLRRLMRKALKGLSGDLSSALAGAGVHAARKRLKLSRSLLRMIAPALGEEAFEREDACLREASHALAGMRRSEAMIEVVHKLASARKGGDAAVLDALADAVGRMQASHDDNGDLAARIAAALAQIEALHGRLADWRLPKRDVRLFAAGMEASYARARKKLNQGLASGEMALLHESRKSIIHHYHHLDLLKPLWPKLLAVWLAELQDLREALGDLNDLDDLDGFLDRGEIVFADECMTGAVRKLIAARRHELIDRIGKETGHLFAERPTSFGDRMAALWERWLA